MPARSLPLAWLALTVALLPAAVIVTSYFVSAAGGHVGWCCPVLDGCTSISATGRHGISYFIFKGGMIPAGVLLAAFWWLNREWLIANGDPGGAATRMITVLGCISALFLIVYTLFLGHKGDVYNLLRRYGVNVHFAFAYLAQILLFSRVRALTLAGRLRLPGWLSGSLLALLVVMLLIGLASIPLANFMANRNQPQNMAAWTLSLLIVLYYLLIWVAWRKTDFRIEFPPVRYDKARR